MAFAGLVLGRQVARANCASYFGAQNFCQSEWAVFPVQNTRRIFEFSKMDEKSLGTAFLMVESAAPSMLQEESTSQSAMLCHKRKSFRSWMAFSLSGALFAVERFSPKTAGRTRQNLFCGCM